MLLRWVAHDRDAGDTWLFNGPATKNGMPDFTGKLQPADVPKLQAFIQGTADAVRPKSN